MKKEIHKAINWNLPNHQFYDDIYIKQVEQFWLPEEIPVSDDKSVWDNLDSNIKETYERILAGLTLLDTEQTVGVTKLGDKTDNLFIKSILTLFAGFETIHARSYSTIFQTLCTSDRIDELFSWIENTKELQNKVSMIIKTYESIEDKESLFMSMVGSLCLEGICFYSGFFLPLWLSGQGKMVNSGEIINLILRDEKLHTVGVGFFAKDIYKDFSEDVKIKLREKALKMVYEVYLAELEYSKLLYKNLGLLDEVKTYLEFNVNYALSCIDFEPMFNVTENDVNSVVMNGYSTETKTHDFFSTKGNGYIKTTKVEDLTDEDFELDEVFFAESFKGTRTANMPRKSRKRGKEIKKRGISKEQICVATALDRQGNLIIEPLCKGRMTHKELERLYKGHIGESSILCTDSHKSYIKFASDFNLDHKRIKTGKHKEGIYHIQHINSLTQ